MDYFALNSLLGRFEEGRTLLARFNRQDSYLPRGIIGKVVDFFDWPYDIYGYFHEDLDRLHEARYPKWNYVIRIKWPNYQDTDGGYREYTEYGLEDGEIELFEQTPILNPDQIHLFTTSNKKQSSAKANSPSYLFYLLS